MTGPENTIDLDRERRIRETITEIRADVEADASLAERTDAMLRGEIDCPDLEAPAMKQDVQISMRLPQELLDRAEALVPFLSTLPKFRSSRVTRSFALREALFEGIEAFEALEAKAGPPVSTRSTRSAKRPRR